MQIHYAADSPRCPRCDLPLRRVGIACDRRSCRPAALRVIRLCALDKDTDPGSSVFGSMNEREHIAEPEEPITAQGMGMPGLEQ